MASTDDPPISQDQPENDTVEVRERRSDGRVRLPNGRMPLPNCKQPTAPPEAPQTRSMPTASIGGMKLKNLVGHTRKS